MIQLINFQLRYKTCTVKNLAFLFILLFMLGCEADKPDSETSLEAIFINNTKAKGQQNIDEIIDTILFCPLETSLQSLVGDHPSQILLFKERIYLVNQGLVSNFSIFGLKKGNFIRAVSSQGGGPEEFSSITDFSINPFSDQLSVFAGFENKELYYNLDGNFLAENDQFLLYNNKSYVDADGSIVHCYSNNADLSGLGASFELIKLKKQKIEEGLKTLENKHPINLSSSYIFYSYEDSIRYLKPYCDTIFDVTNGVLKERYQIKFKRGAVNPEFWTRSSLKGTKDEIHARHHIPSLFPAMAETKKYLFGSYVSTNNQAYYFAYDKKNKNVVLNFGRLWYSKWDIPLPPPMHFYNEGLVYLISPVELQLMLKQHPNPSLLPASFRKIVTSLSADSNPVLVMVKMK